MFLGWEVLVAVLMCGRLLCHVSAARRLDCSWRGRTSSWWWVSSRNCFIFKPCGAEGFHSHRTFRVSWWFLGAGCGHRGTIHAGILRGPHWGSVSTELISTLKEVLHYGFHGMPGRLALLLHDHFPTHPALCFHQPNFKLFAFHSCHGEATLRLLCAKFRDPVVWFTSNTAVGYILNIGLVHLKLDKWMSVFFPFRKCAFHFSSCAV